MRVNSLDHADSDDDYINYLTNMTICNIAREEESDIEEEKTMNYFKHKITSLEDSFIKVKRRKKDHPSLDLEKRDKEFLLDLIKTLFKEVSDISDNSLKIYTRNLHKTENINKITTVHKALFEKYIGLKMNYKSGLIQAEYRENQISDLEGLIKACDLEIFSLQSRIAEMTNFFQINKNNMHRVSNWAFKEDADCTLRKIINDFEEKKSLCDEINTVMAKEKENLAKIVGNLRNSLAKKENAIDDLKIEVGLKNTQINELIDENDKIKSIYERCKMKLEIETKINLANADRVKYLTESIRMKEDRSDEDESIKDLNTETKKKVSNRSLKKRYKSCINLDEIMDDIEKENSRDFSYQRKISFMNSKKEDVNPAKSYKNFNPIYSMNKKPAAYLNAFNLSPTREEFNEENCTRISEANLVSVSIMNQSQLYEEDRSRSPSENSRLSRNKLELENSQDDHALGLIMSMISDSEEKVNLSKIKRGISRISMTSSIDFIEDGLKNTKSRLAAKNLIENSNFQFQMQNVNNWFINRRRSTKSKATGINLNSNNYNNIININFNNFENKNLEKEQREFLNAHCGSNDEKYVKIYFDFLFESIKIKNRETFASPDSKVINDLDKEEVYRNIVKENIQFYNFAEIIQKKMSERRNNCNIEENIIERDEEIEIKNKAQMTNKVNSKRLNYNFYFKKILKLKKNIFELKQKYSMGKSHLLKELKIVSEIDINFTSPKNTNLQIDKFEISITNSTIQTSISSNKEKIEQPNSDGLKTLYNKYFKYSDNFLNDTMKSQTPIRNFNHLFPNSKWNKYISKHNPEVSSNGLVKYNKPALQNLNNKNVDQFTQKCVQNKSPMFINFMQTQYYYSKLLSKKNWSNKD